MGMGILKKAIRKWLYRSHGLVIRSLELDDSFSRIEIRSLELDIRSLELQVVSSNYKLSNSRERIAIR